MSHFTVIVIGEDVHAQLAPYAEEGFDKKYASFEDTEEESLSEYKNSKVDLVVLKDGSIYGKYDDRFSEYNHERFERIYTYPEGTEFREGNFCELYPTFELFMKEWRGSESRDEETGRYGYWYNPSAKWDWYVVGGRWTGYFKPKDGTTGELGESGSFRNTPENGWVDIIKLQDIDIEHMRDLAAKKANKTYDSLEEITKGRPLPSWEEIKERNGNNINAAREEYGSLQVVKDLHDANFFVFGGLYETFGPNREAYVERCKNSTMVPHAVVKDGKWYQVGEMGWFGSSTSEMTEDEWNKQFWEMINNLDPETTLTLVDCHI